MMAPQQRPYPQQMAGAPQDDSITGLLGLQSLLVQRLALPGHAVQAPAVMVVFSANLTCLDEKETGLEAWPRS